jgi:hypothetical protein
MSEQKPPPQVYAAIAEVMAKISKVGISKDRTASTGGQGSYKFRGIDDVYNALAPFLAEAKLAIMPRVLSREITERQSAQGKALFYVVLDVEFDFVSASDGSKHTVRVMGEAMDSGDKATNKAMSAAYKYACMQTFCIPTEGDNDADATTHEVKAVAPPDGYEKWKADMVAVADEGTERLQAAWGTSAAALRNHAVKHDLQWWNATKALAGKNQRAA